MYGVWSHTPWVVCPAVQHKIKVLWTPNKWSMTPNTPHNHLCFLVCHGLTMPVFKYLKLICCGFEKNHTTWWEKHTTWPKRIPHGHLVCSYIQYDTYQLLYHVVCQQPWHNMLYLEVVCRPWLFATAYLHTMFAIHDHNMYADQIIRMTTIPLINSTKWFYSL